MLKKIALLSLFTVLTGCQTAGEQAFTKQVQELTARLDKIEKVQTEIAQRSGMGALVRPERLEFADGHQIGDVKAKVAMLEFTELQCPFCAKFQNEIWPTLKKEYVDTGKVLFIGRDNPLYQQHVQAPYAALALKCAAKQDIYEPIKTYLLANPGALEEEKIGEEFVKLKGDKVALKTCMEDKELRKSIGVSTQYAARLGVQSTPTFFIGKNETTHVSEYQEIVGAKSVEEFRAVLDQLLAK